MTICYDCLGSTIGRCWAHGGGAIGLDLAQSVLPHQHYWTFSRVVNERYDDGTVVVAADAVMVCHGCGAWKVEAQTP